jgi:hypothetical protein
MKAGAGKFVTQIETFVAMRDDDSALRVLFLLVFHLPLISAHAGVLGVPSAFRLSTTTVSAATQWVTLIAANVVFVRRLKSVFSFMRLDFWKEAQALAFG